MLGHTIGAAGAIEAILTLEGIRRSLLLPTINYETPDPRCDLDYVPNEARRVAHRVALVELLRVRGHNASICIGAYEDSDALSVHRPRHESRARTPHHGDQVVCRHRAVPGVALHPGRPGPGVLLIEAMAQLLGWLASYSYDFRCVAVLALMSEVTVPAALKPGARVEIEAAS